MAERNALLDAIKNGKSLKKTVTVDKSGVKGAGGVIGKPGEKPPPTEPDTAAPDLKAMKANLAAMFKPPGAPAPPPMAPPPMAPPLMTPPPMAPPPMAPPRLAPPPMAPPLLAPPPLAPPPLAPPPLAPPPLAPPSILAPPPLPGASGGMAPSPSLSTLSSPEVSPPLGVDAGKKREKRKSKSSKRLSLNAPGMAANGNEQQSRWVTAPKAADPCSSSGAGAGSSILAAEGASANGSKTKRVSVVEPTDPTRRDREGSVASTVGDAPSDASSALVLERPSGSALVEAQRNEKAEVKRAKEEAARELLERRARDSLMMLRNIPIVQCAIVGAMPSKMAMPSASFEGSTHSKMAMSSSYTVYQIELSVHKDEFKEAKHTVWHRYSDFVNLHHVLHKRWGNHAEFPKLPAKKMTMMGLSHKQIEERRKGLDAYLKELFEKLNWSIEPNIRAFIQADQWVHERRTRAVSSSAAPAR